MRLSHVSVSQGFVKIAGIAIGLMGSNPTNMLFVGTEVREIGDNIRTAKCFGRVRSEYELSLGTANAVSTAGTVALMFAFWTRERERKTKAREIASSDSDTHP